MSLDLVLLRADGRLCAEASIGVVLHVELMDLAERLRLPLLQRLRAHDEDVEFTPLEVLELTRELDRAIRSGLASERLLGVLVWMKAVATRAEGGSGKLKVLGD